MLKMCGTSLLDHLWLSRWKIFCFLLVGRGLFLGWGFLFLDLVDWRLMSQIEHGLGVCTVIVTLDAEREDMGDLLSHARMGLERFAEWEGFVAGALHLSQDGTRLVQYLQWASEEVYVRCRDAPVWEHLSSTRRFMAHVDAGRARVDARVFSVLASAVAPV